MSAPLCLSVRLFTLAASLCLLLPCAAGTGEVPEYYEVLLGTLGGKTSEALGLNERGQVVGISETAAGETHAFLWERGRMRDLGTLLGGRMSVASDVNDRGEAVGWARNSSGQRRAVYWQGRAPLDLGTLGGKESWANAISEDGEIVGAAQRRWWRTDPHERWAFSARVKGRGLRGHRVKMRPLPRILASEGPRVIYSEATGVHDGLIVGSLRGVTAKRYADGHFTWRGSSVYAPITDSFDSRILGLSRNGLVAGVNVDGTSGQYRGWTGVVQFLYIDSSVVWLPDGYDRHQSGLEARSVNSAGEVVGNVFPQEGPEPHKPVRGFVARGRVTRLLSELLPEGSATTILNANAINDRGQIVGQAERNGRRVAYLLMPTRTPTAP